MAQTTDVGQVVDVADLHRIDVYESTGGYNGAHVVHVPPIVDGMEQLRQLRPDVYAESRYPILSEIRRYRNIFDFCMDTVTIDRCYPYIGDGGSIPVYRKLSKIAWHDADAPAFEHAYRVFRDPKFAWALTHEPGWKPSSDFPFTKAEIEQEAAKWARCKMRIFASCRLCFHPVFLLTPWRAAWQEC